MTMTMTMTMGGSKNVTNSENGDKMVGKKGDILNFSIKSIHNEQDHGHDQGGSKNVTNSIKVGKK